MMKDDLISFYAFNRWATALVLKAIRPLSAEQYAQEPAPGWSPVRDTVIHVAGATQIWLNRLQGANPARRLSVEDLPTFDDAVRVFEQAHDGFDQFLAGLSAEQLQEVVAYRNIQGDPFQLPLWVLLRHVVNHATYHRGQIASKLKLLGFPCPDTDLVFWALEQGQGEKS